jgi:hypothetical protein
MASLSVLGGALPELLNFRTTINDKGQIAVKKRLPIPDLEANSTICRSSVKNAAPPALDSGKKEEPNDI